MRVPRFTTSRQSPSRDGEKWGANLLAIQAKRDRQRQRIRRLIYVFFAGLFLIAITWIFLRSPIVRLRSLEIDGNRQMSDRDVMILLQSRVFKMPSMRFLGFRNLIAWPEEVSAEDLKLFPGVKSVSIEKKYSEGKITVRVVERETYGIWCFMNYDFPRCVWFDLEGVALERAPFAEGSLITQVSDFAQDSPRLNARVIPAKFIPPLFSIFRVLEESGLRVLAIHLKNLDLQELSVITAEGPRLLFSLRFPAENTLGVLRSLRAETSPGAKPFRELEYVDFRVEHRAYYK